MEERERRIGSSQTVVAEPTASLSSAAASIPQSLTTKVFLDLFQAWKSFYSVFFSHYLHHTNKIMNQL